MLLVYCSAGLRVKKPRFFSFCQEPPPFHRQVILSWCPCVSVLCFFRIFLSDLSRALVLVHICCLRVDFVINECGRFEKHVFNEKYPLAAKTITLIDYISGSTYITICLEYTTNSTSSKPKHIASIPLGTLPR